jgi:hypothetical protein
VYFRKAFIEISVCHASGNGLLQSNSSVTSGPFSCSGRFCHTMVSGKATSTKAIKPVRARTSMDVLYSIMQSMEVRHFSHPPCTLL